MDGPSSLISSAIVEVGRERFVIPTSMVREFVDLNAVSISGMPGCRPPCKGIARHRDSVMPVIDMRELLEYQTFESTVDELAEILAARERDHVAWLEDLQRCCQSGDEFKKATDPHKCAFGKWYDALRASEKRMAEITDGDQGITHLIASFDAPHRRIHGIAEEALGLAASGDLDGATEVIDRTWNTELGTMRELFGKLLDAVRTRRRPRLVVSEVEGGLVAFVVDKIIAIDDIDPSSMQETGVEPGTDRLVRGCVISEKYGQLLLFDADRLREKVSTHAKAA